MLERETVADLSGRLHDSVPSESKVGKLVAMGFYQGLEQYAGPEGSKVGEMSAVASTLSGYLERAFEGDADEGSINRLAFDVRRSIGELDDHVRSAYDGPSELFPYIHKIVTHGPNHGENFRRLGRGLVRVLRDLDQLKVRGDSDDTRLVREYDEVFNYVTGKIGGHQ